MPPTPPAPTNAECLLGNRPLGAAPEFSDLAAARAALVTLGPDYVLCGGIDKPYRLLHCSTLPTYQGGEDGPIREPGDDAASWDDAYTADELVTALNYQATRQAKAGATHIAEELNCAADAISDMAEKLEASRDTTARLVQKIADLRKQLRSETERCSEHRDCLAGAGHAGECDIDFEARS